MFNKLKQFKDLRDQAKTMQNALAGETVYADSGHGKIQVVMDGNQHVNGVSVDPEFLAPNKKGELERNLQEAFNNAVDEVTDAARRLIEALVTTAPPRDREEVAAKARERTAVRYGR